MPSLRLLCALGLGTLLAAQAPLNLAPRATAAASEVALPATSTGVSSTLPSPAPLHLVEQTRTLYRPVHHRPGQRPKSQDLATYASAIRAGKTHDEARAGKGTPP